MLPNRELNSLELPFRSLLVLKLAGLTLGLTGSGESKIKAAPIEIAGK